MQCFYCGEEIGNTYVCPVCGASQQAYRRILYAADAAYNDGLHRANARDLSGAAESLNLSLKYNKYHTSARNLLGLVYFETGEMVAAVREWVISKNLQPENNGADAYLEDLEKSGTLKHFDQTTRKYNQALSYCLQGSRDLARIQLRRVLLANPKMVKAHQLLALVCMQDGKYEEARKSLSAAAKIDHKNPLTMDYKQEVKETLKAKGKGRRRRQREMSDVDPTEYMNLTQSSFHLMDSAGSGIINVFVGILLGILASVFLIMPSMREEMNSDAASALVSANEEAANSRNNVSTLQKQVDDLTAQLEEYTGKADIKTSYEQLLVTENAILENDFETAKNSIENVSRELLDASGQARYDNIMAQVNTQVTADNYKAAAEAYKAQEYTKAVSLLEQVVLTDEMYDGGNALFTLAQACDKAEKYQDALIHYSRFISAYPSTRRASTAQTAINRIVADTGLEVPEIPEEEPSAEGESDDSTEEGLGQE